MTGVVGAALISGLVGAGILDQCSKDEIQPEIVEDSTDLEEIQGQTCEQVQKILDTGFLE